MIIEKKQSKKSLKATIIAAVILIIIIAAAVFFYNNNEKKKQAELRREILLAKDVMVDATKWFLTHNANVTVMYDSILMHLCEDDGINEQNIGKVLDSFQQAKKMLEENKNENYAIGGKMYSYKNIPSDVMIAIGNNFYSTNKDTAYNMFIGGSEFYNRVLSNAGTQILPYIKNDGKAYFSVGANLANQKYKKCGVIYYEYEADNFKKFILQDILDNVTAGDKERDLYFIQLDENNNPIILTGLNEKKYYKKCL